MNRATTPARWYRGAAAGVAVVTALLTAVGVTVADTSAAAQSSAPLADPVDDSVDGTPWIISLGDSYISGEGGRWAGNSVTLPQSATDALGPTAYFDNPTDTGELIPYCHRSKSAEVHIRSTNTLNLACSGAETSTYWTGFFGTTFKPGIDFYDDGNGHHGQARMLQDAATGKDVGLVVLSIGGNDFDVAGAAETCVEDFTESNPFQSWYCNQDANVTGRFTPDAARAVQTDIVQAIANIRTAMADAGHADDDYTLVVQTYPQPLPRGADFRYPESGYTRVSTGGCGFWDVDADWMVGDMLSVVNDTVRGAIAEAGGDIVTLELDELMADRRLCATTVGLLEEVGLTSWTDPTAVDRTEWLNQIHIVTVGGDHFLQESLHPNYWAQLALRNCLRQVWNDGAPRSGTCVRGAGLNTAGEPNVSLRPAVTGGPSTTLPPPEPTTESTTSPAARERAASAVRAVPRFTG